MKRPMKTMQMQRLGPHSVLIMGKQCNGGPEVVMGNGHKRDTMPLLERPLPESPEYRKRNGSFQSSSCRLHGGYRAMQSLGSSLEEKSAVSKVQFEASEDSPTSDNASLSSSPDRCPELSRAIQSVRYMAELTKEEEESNKVKEDWKFVAMVLDRLFLWIFSIAVVVGTAGIILQAPSLYDLRPAIDELLSEIQQEKAPIRV